MSTHGCLQHIQVTHRSQLAHPESSSSASFLTPYLPLYSHRNMKRSEWAVLPQRSCWPSVAGGVDVFQAGPVQGLLYLQLRLKDSET